jgi:hypothetical protein
MATKPKVGQIRQRSAEPDPSREAYIVFKSNIMDDDGVIHSHGDTVHLSPKLARRYNNLGYLKPCITDEPDDEEDTDPAGLRGANFNDEEDDDEPETEEDDSEAGTGMGKPDSTLNKLPDALPTPSAKKPERPGS